MSTNPSFLRALSSGYASGPVIFWLGDRHCKHTEVELQRCPAQRGTGLQGG